MTHDIHDPSPQDRPNGGRRWVGIAASVFAVVVTPLLLIWTTNIPVDTGPRVATVNPTTYAQLTAIAEDRAARESRVATRAARLVGTPPAGTPSAAEATAAPAAQKQMAKGKAKAKQTPSAGARGKRTPTPQP